MKQAMIQIDAGDTTCASERGKFCRYMQYYSWQSTAAAGHCGMFDSPLYDVDGWIRRCDPCLKTFREDAE